MRKNVAEVQKDAKVHWAAHALSVSFRKRKERVRGKVAADRATCGFSVSVAVLETPFHLFVADVHCM